MRGGSKASGWTLAGGTRSLEPPEQDSSSEDEATCRMTRTRSLLSASVESEVATPITDGKPTATSPVGEIRPPEVRLRSNSSTSSDRDRQSSTENALESSDNSAHNRRISSSATSATIRSKTGSVANGGGGRGAGRRSTHDDERKSDLLTAEHTSVSQVNLPRYVDMREKNEGL